MTNTRDLAVPGAGSDDPRGSSSPHAVPPDRRRLGAYCTVAGGVVCSITPFLPWFTLTSGWSGNGTVSLSTAAHSANVPGLGSFAVLASIWLFVVIVLVVLPLVPLPPARTGWATLLVALAGGGALAAGIGHLAGGVDLQLAHLGWCTGALGLALAAAGSTIRIAGGKRGR